MKSFSYASPQALAYLAEVGLAWTIERDKIPELWDWWHICEVSKPARLALLLRPYAECWAGDGIFEVDGLLQLGRYDKRVMTEVVQLRQQFHSKGWFAYLRTKPRREDGPTFSRGSVLSPRLSSEVSIRLEVVR